MLGDILVILVLVLINGLFAGAELAVVTVRKTRVAQLVDEWVPSAKAVAALRANPERLLATVQVGITVVGASAGAFGGDTLAGHLTPLLRPIVGDAAHQLGFVLVVVGISYCSLVLGELVPKSLALRSSDRYALLVGQPLLWVSFVARPVVWFLTASSNAVLRLFGDQTSFTESRMSAEELKVLLEDASNAGTLSPDVGAIASRAVELAGLKARDVMVHRNQIVAFDRGTDPTGLWRLLTEAVHNRVVIFDGTMDHVAGYVAVRQVYACGLDRFNVNSILQPIRFVPEAMPAVDVLNALRESGDALAIVVDEFGGTSGLVTREDIAEELLGEATAGEYGGTEYHVVRHNDGSLVVPAGMAVRDVNREADLQLPEGDKWSSMAGLCIAMVGRVPIRGERIELSRGTIIEVLDATPRRLLTLRIVPPQLRAETA